MLSLFTGTLQDRKTEKPWRSCVSSVLSLEHCAPWSQQRWRTPARCVCMFMLMCEFVCMFLWSGSINSPGCFGSKPSPMTAWAALEAEVNSQACGTELFRLQDDVHTALWPDRQEPFTHHKPLTHRLVCSGHSYPVWQRHRVHAHQFKISSFRGIFILERVPLCAGYYTFYSLFLFCYKEDCLIVHP